VVECRICNREVAAGFPLTWKVGESQGIFLVREKSGNFVCSQGKLAMIIHVARVLWPSVVVTDHLRHTRSFIGAYSSKSTLSVIVLVFLKIMAMERSRRRGGGTDYKLHKTSSSICIRSGNSSKHSQGKSGKNQGISFLNLSGNPVLVRISAGATSHQGLLSLPSLRGR